LSTQGCKFNCSYCPIPGVNQRTWRHKSPQRFAAEIKHIHETFGIREFFGTDDNFFNNRQTVIDLMTALAGATTGGAPLSTRINLYTEATEFDVYKNRDLLPLCRRAGLRAIWFGIEDITAKLVNKGQSADKTAGLFATLSRLGIQPMAMTIHSDDQPLRSAPESLAGLLNQARYLSGMGAVSYQCTYLGPAVGTRDFEPAARAGIMFKSVGGQPVPQAFQDGNHVAASRHPKPWWRQINVLLGYAGFYNPLNTLRSIARLGREPLASKKLLFQIIGQIGLVMTLPKLLHWAFKLRRGPVECWNGLQPARIPMIDPVSGLEMNWAIKRIPASHLPRAVVRTRPSATLMPLPILAASC
ncbi:MAG: radical SAM protein, partial [Planctomycetes bacterium]|nr:radical SAM protein [Planctomycetota bacterium]